MVMLEKIKQLLVTSRPISWVNTSYPFAAGYLMTTHSIDNIFVIGSIFYLIPYNLLMYGVNDVYDYESDLRNPRKGGIEGAKLAKHTHQFILISAYLLSAPFIVYLLYTSHRPWGYMVFLLNIFLVLAYSLPKLRFKERPFIDSMTSSSHFVGPLIFAMTFTTFSSSYWVIIGSFFLWGMASHAFGAVQDIKADKAGGIGSIATVIGAKSTVRFSIILYGISAISLLYFGIAGLIACLIEFVYIANIWQFRNLADDDAEKSNIAWKRFIKINLFAGFLITLILIQIYRSAL
jgi:4-hydroxybenzoate polyprenyltransferase